MKASRLRAGVAALGLAAAGGEAGAHVINDPRVLVVVAKPGSLEIRVNDMSQPGEESVALRRRYDADRDGKIDDSEGSDLASFLVVRATKNLKVWQGGKPVSLKEKTRALKGIAGGVDSSDALSIDVVLVVTPSATGGRVAVTLGDWRPDGHAVRAAVLADGGAKLLKSSLGDLELERGVVTGVSLDQNVTEALEYEVPR